MVDVVVWSMTGCVWCDRVCELLADRGIPFAKHQPPLAELKPKLLELGLRTLPQVWVDGERIGGFEATKDWLAAAEGTRT